MRISLLDAGTRLRKGEVVAVPTETVYGLAACLDQPQAIQEIYTLKSRPPQNPLIIHVGAPDLIKSYVDELPEKFDDLADFFWPGPLTLVLPVKGDAVSKIATAGLRSAAFRVPAHPLAKELLKLTGPLVMPSANLSGKPSATSASHVEDDFGKEFPVLDGGPSQEGLESTILIWDEKKWVVGRLGALAPEEFLPVLRVIPEMAGKGLTGKELNETPTCPGQMYRHYAPKARLTLTLKIPHTAQKSQVIVGFSDKNYPERFKIYSLGSSAEPKIAAKHLYAVLRQLDVDGVKEAFVDIDFPDSGLWATLKERLKKAANSLSD